MTKINKVVDTQYLSTHSIRTLIENLEYYLGRGYDCENEFRVSIFMDVHYCTNAESLSTIIEQLKHDSKIFEDISDRVAYDCRANTGALIKERLETDKEYEKRLNKENKMKERAEARERKQYERLKKKFEGEQS
jgi:hypothetical protein